MIAWLKGFGDYYAANRRRTFRTWMLFTILIGVCWIVNVLPFVHGGVATTGRMVQRHCAGSSFAYSYVYVVGGQTYTGTSRWGVTDGNGPCDKLSAGSPVSITYLSDDPARSMGGTVQDWNRALRFYLCFALVAFLGPAPLLMYLAELTNAGKKQASRQRQQTSRR